MERFRDETTELKRLAFVIVGRSRHPFDAPEPSVAYVPKGSDTKTIQAITDLIRRLLGDFAAFEVVGAPIQYKFSANEHEVIVPGILTYRISSENRAPHESVAGSLYPWLADPVQGVAKEVSYSRAGNSFSYRGTNALFARLELEE